jgi:hypothetical protein
MKRKILRGRYSPELLEARIAPATFIVNSLLDHGSDGTLRQQNNAANDWLAAQENRGRQLMTAAGAADAFPALFRPEQTC